MKWMLDVYKRQMQDNLRFVSFFDLDMMDLKALGRFRQKTIKQRTRLKIQLTTYVDQVFPEIQYFFKSGLHQHAVYALLKEAPSPKEIASMHMTHLATLLKMCIRDSFKRLKIVVQILRHINRIIKLDLKKHFKYMFPKFRSYHSNSSLLS